MKQLVAFELEGGGTVIAEVDEAPDPNAEYVRTAGGDATKVSKASQTFDEAIIVIRSSAGKVLDEVKALDREDAQLSSVEVTFGVKLSGKVGAILASSEAEANFAVTLKWTRA